MNTYVWNEKGKPIVVVMAKTEEEARRVVQSQTPVQYQGVIKNEENLTVLKPGVVMVIK